MGEVFQIFCYLLYFLYNLISPLSIIGSSVLFIYLDNPLALTNIKGSSTSILRLLTLQPCPNFKLQNLTALNIIFKACFSTLFRDLLKFTLFFII